MARLERLTRTGAALCLVSVTLAQEPAPSAPATIELGARTIDVSKLENRLHSEWSSAPGRAWLLLVDGALDRARRDELRRAGILVLDLLPRGGLVVNLDRAAGPVLAGLGFVRWLGEYRESFKLDPALETAQGAETREVIITLFRDGSERQVLDALSSIAGASFLSRDRTAAKERIRATLPVADLTRIVALDAVQSVEAVGDRPAPGAAAGCGSEDSDGDGIGDLCDNCSSVPNPGQQDSDLPCTCCLGTACNQFSCKAAVCAVNPSCCFGWNSSCQGVAYEICPCCHQGPDGIGDACDNCPFGHNPGQEDMDFTCNCCKGGDPQGCDDDACEETVCGVDPFCCDTEWDAMCDEEAQHLCACCAGDGVGDACDKCPFVQSPNQTDGDLDGVGDLCDNCPADPNPKQEDYEACVCCKSGNCNNDDCESLVCARDPSCCQAQWDSACKELAKSLCDCCDGDGHGDECDNCEFVFNPGQENADPGCNCCSGGNGLGCSNDGCEAAVCSRNPSCCSEGWDAHCDDAAASECGCCAPDEFGDACDNCPTVYNPSQADNDPQCNCCSGGDALGCNDDRCEAQVCDLDPFCCEVDWDSICNGEAHCVCICCTPDGDGAGDACDTCPDIYNPGGVRVLFGQTIVALGTKTDFGWPESAEYAFVRGDFAASSDVGAYEFRLFGFDRGVQLHDETSPSGGAGLWYLLRPACHAGSWSSGGPGEVVPGADAVLP